LNGSSEKGPHRGVSEGKRYRGEFFAEKEGSFGVGGKLRENLKKEV